MPNTSPPRWSAPSPNTSATGRLRAASRHRARHPVAGRIVWATRPPPGTPDDITIGSPKVGIGVRGKWAPKWHQNGSKMGPKMTPVVSITDPQFIPKGSPKDPQLFQKNVPKVSQNGLKMIPQDPRNTPQHIPNRAPIPMSKSYSQPFVFVFFCFCVFVVVFVFGFLGVVADRRTKKRDGKSR